MILFKCDQNIISKILKEILSQFFFTMSFIQVSGDLFELVQQSNIFQDSKDFVDSIPNKDPKIIIELFLKNKDQFHDPLKLKNFIHEHFNLPKRIRNRTIKEYIESLWSFLTRYPNPNFNEYDSLINVPFQYIVPGGRFEEFYYWDTYFTSLGLAVVNKYDIIENMIDNFIYLLSKYDIIPNGTRIYYLSRSQPPVLSLLIELLYNKDGIIKIEKYLPYLEKEFNYWTSNDKIYKFEDNSFLCHYYDSKDIPREESFIEDLNTSKNIQNEIEKKKLYRNLRSGAESGWDFSSRWLKNNNNLDSIHIIDLLPIDLNCLIYKLCYLLFKFYKELNNFEKSDFYFNHSINLKNNIQKYLWDNNNKFYFDYDFKEKKIKNNFTLAAVLPLFVEISTIEQSFEISKILKEKFLKVGGLVTTLIESNLQWDYPNGWAPLQWFSVKGLLNYQINDLAFIIMKRWNENIENYFNFNKKILEKYNVIDPLKTPIGGEYLVQEGFGWTNGIYLQFDSYLKF